MSFDFVLVFATGGRREGEGGGNSERAHAGQCGAWRAQALGGAGGPAAGKGTAQPGVSIWA